MREYETFVYLDVKKTGSSFVRAFLRKCSSEKLVRSAPHAGVPEDYDATKFHFISVRHPLDQYVSLYSFGFQASGQLFGRLHKRGFGHLYDGTTKNFQYWLDFVLDPQNAAQLGDGYGEPKAGRISQFVGLQSYRVLKLAVPQTNKLLAPCESEAAIREAYHSKKLPDHAIKTESLRADLMELVDSRLPHSFADPAAAKKFLETEPPRNTSIRLAAFATNAIVTKEQKTRLARREWLMFEMFGY